MEQISMVGMMRQHTLICQGSFLKYTNNCKLIPKQVKECIVDKVFLGKAKVTLLHQLPDTVAWMIITSHLHKNKDLLGKIRTSGRDTEMDSLCKNASQWAR